MTCRYILTFIAVFFFQITRAQDPKGKLFIIGGGARPDALMERMIQEAGLGRGGYVVVLPMSSEEPDSSVWYACQPFLKKGITQIRGLNFLKGEASPGTKIDSIRNATLIYITGGDQSRFMNIAGGTAIEQAIVDAYRRGCLIAGSSAGAAVMSKLMITGNELKHPEYSSTFQNIEEQNIEIKRGLGLVETAIIDQHFVKRSRHNRLLSAVIEYPEMKCIGIDESTAILIKGKQVEVVGESQVIVYENRARSKIVKSGRLGARGIIVNVFLNGDIFTLPEVRSSGK